MIPMTQAPPAQVQSAPERELTFPGFNGAPLKGSLRPAQGQGQNQVQGWFAVLVAGSGPTDRDWSSPLLPVPSHGGRDLAAWLAAQGVGSLRYDKRFIGSKDPKLDISLDAQVGDIKAAIAYARALPEAKGRRILLVGHSEGALLSLVAAGSSDALLLLEPPSQSMASTIKEQLRLQLPPERSAANLAYLDAVFDAIRQGRSEAPRAGDSVYPNLEKLGRSFLAPESLGFVKATLDLDPWVLAARSPVPTAMAWGDKDVQTWKPVLVPADYKGAVLELKDSNHVLKRETRPRAELDGPAAVAGYGDAVPQADLSPLGAWIRSLK